MKVKKAILCALAGACVLLYAAAAIRYGKMSGTGFMGEPQYYLYAASGMFAIVCFCVIVLPARASAARRALLMKEHGERVTADVEPEIVTVPLRLVEATSGILSYEIDPAFKMPQLCACCAAEGEMTRVRESFATPRMRRDSKGRLYGVPRVLKYVEFEFPYCRPCEMHVRLGRLSPYMALYFASLMLPVIVILLNLVMSKRTIPGDVLFAAVSILAPAFFLVGLCYIFFARQTTDVPRKYHWAGAIVGALFFAVPFYPLSVCVLFGFALAAAMPKLLGLGRSLQCCTHRRDGRAVTCRIGSGKANLFCANRAFAEKIRNSLPLA